MAFTTPFKVFWSGLARTGNVIDNTLIMAENATKIGVELSEDYLEEQRYQRELRLAERRIQRLNAPKPQPQAVIEQ